MGNICPFMHEAEIALKKSSQMFLVYKPEIEGDLDDFMLVFPPGGQLPYNRDLVADIEAARKSFEGTLFIDRVLRALGIAKGRSNSRLNGSEAQVVGC